MQVPGGFLARAGPTNHTAPCGTTRIASYKKKNDDATTQRLMQQGLTLPCAYRLAKKGFPATRHALEMVPLVVGMIYVPEDPVNFTGQARVRWSLFESPPRPSTSTTESSSTVPSQPHPRDICLHLPLLQWLMLLQLACLAEVHGGRENYRKMGRKAEQTRLTVVEGVGCCCLLMAMKG